MIGRVAALIALGRRGRSRSSSCSGGGEDYKVTAEFENASQLVKGNEVVVGGTAVGTVKEIELGDDGQALVTFTVDEDYAPLRARHGRDRPLALALADRRPPGPARPCRPTPRPASEIADGGTLTQAETVSAVDLDQLFNTLDPKTIKDFKHVIQGFEHLLRGRRRAGEQRLQAT